MNSRLLSALALPRGRVIAALVAAAAFAVCRPERSSRRRQRRSAQGAAEGRAEDASRRPKKDAPPAAAQQQPRAGRSRSRTQVQLIYSPWTKFCLKGQDANAKQVCFTGKDGRIESGQPVVPP